MMRPALFFAIVMMTLGTAGCLLAYVLLQMGYVYWPTWAILAAGIFALWGGAMQARG
jgi:hypothetical protein